MRRRKRIEVSICAWIDLLGYGSMLKDAGFDPSLELAQDAINRLEIFHKTASEFATRKFNIFAINDGLICNMDLSSDSKRIPMNFIKNVIELHNEINRIDVENGFYGARTIISAGFRVRKVNSVTIVSGVRDFLLDKISKNAIKPKEAVNMAIKSRPYFGIIPELQANFAFTKSYLVDTDGSSAGFKGPNCFIDLAVFEKPMPKFIRFSNYINWNKFGLSAKFGELKEVDLNKMTEMKGAGFLDARGVGENITSSPEVLERINKISRTVMREKNEKILSEKTKLKKKE